MSIFNLGCSEAEALSLSVENFRPVLDALVADMGLSNSSEFQLIREGVAPYIVLGLSNDHLDALFFHGLTKLRAGKVADAQIVFLKLITLKEIDYRFWYALGATLQVEERFDNAARAYTISLALKATYVDGHLRLGECLLANGELSEAIGCFQLSIALCEDGHGDSDQMNCAQHLLAHAEYAMDADIDSVDRNQFGGT